MDDSNKKNVKVAQPDLYHGEREKLEDWLMQLDLYLTFQETNLPAQKRTAFAITYMRGRAQKWIAPH